MMRGQLKQAMWCTRISCIRWQRRGVSLIEVLIGILIILVASIGTLTYFATGFGNIGKQGNRRAALEQARERLEQILASNLADITPPTAAPPTPAGYWVSCTGGSPCQWVGADPAETAQVDDLPNQPVESFVRWENDSLTAGTSNTLLLTARIWFTSSTALDDFNRVELVTLRTP